MNLSKYIKSLPMLLTLLVLTACEDESKAPVVTYDSAGKGAYVKFVDESGIQLVNLLSQANFDASQYQYSVEFIDGSGGTRVTQYVLNVEYDDVTGANSQGPVVLRSYDASSFTESEAGNKGVSNITITSADLTGAFGLTYADLNAGDNFEIKGELVTADGTWNSTNSSATVNGTAFQGFFDFDMPAGCPSDLTGTFNYSSTNLWCDGGSTTGTVTIISSGGGKYTFNDWSFGGYPHCYGGNAASWGSLSFQDVCAVVSFSGFTDSYGDTWTFVSSISGNDWLISWENTYGESGQTAITFPSGVPFTLN